MVHDFRASSDLLYHQFGLQLVNVFDTMAAHIVVTNWMVERKVTRAKRLYCLVLDYLGVVGPHLPGPCQLDTGTEEEQVMMAAPLFHTRDRTGAPRLRFRLLQTLAPAFPCGNSEDYAKKYIQKARAIHHHSTVSVLLGEGGWQRETIIHLLYYVA